MKMLRNFPIYKAIIFTQILEGKPLKTVDAWNNTIAILDNQAPSRASVINFMKLLEESGYLSSEEVPGKGGYFPIYTLKLSYEEALAKLKDDMLQEFNETILLNIT